MFTHATESNADYRFEQVWTAGICIGLIHDIPTCEVLLQRIETEARDAVQQQAALYKEESKARL
jgi:NAD(P)H-dependent flavin oxidoreductase YrpB (nitropropane dioxygenase family)